MIRNPSFRRFIITAIFFMGSITQLQLVFACESIENPIQYSCCCGEQDAVNHAQACAAGGVCFEGHSRPVSSGENCCEVTYQQAPAMKAIELSSHTRQVILLDAPQPPPLLIPFHLETIPATDHVALYTSNDLLWVTGLQTYLLTNRFRI